MFNEKHSILPPEDQETIKDIYLQREDFEHPSIPQGQGLHLYSVLCTIGLNLRGLNKEFLGIPAITLAQMSRENLQRLKGIGPTRVDIIVATLDILVGNISR